MVEFIFRDIRIKVIHKKEQPIRNFFLLHEATWSIFYFSLCICFILFLQTKFLCIYVYNLENIHSKPGTFTSQLQHQYHLQMTNISRSLFQSLRVESLIGSGPHSWSHPSPGSDVTQVTHMAIRSHTMEGRWAGHKPKKCLLQCYFTKTYLPKVPVVKE